MGSAAEFKDAVVVRGETVGGFAVAAGNDAQLNAAAIQVGHDFGQRLGDALVEADGFAGGFEHRAVLDAVDDFRRVRAEAEVDYFHQLTLLAWCTKRFVSIRANAVPVLHRQGGFPNDSKEMGANKKHSCYMQVRIVLLEPMQQAGIQTFCPRYRLKATALHGA